MENPESKDPETDSILDKLRASLGDTPGTEARPVAEARPGTEAPALVKPPEPEAIKLEEKDIRVFYAFLSDFLASRQEKWRMSEAELDNFTLLTVKLGEKYSAYYLQYSLEATACVTLVLFVLKRIEIKKPIKPIEPS